MHLKIVKTSVAYALLLSISFAVFLIYIIGAARYFTGHEENKCDMTFMFEYPQFVRITGDRENYNYENKEFPRFALYAYGEGFVTERLRKMHFTGIPVLFIPGNAGSYQQVRSLASVSLRKSIKSRTPFHFDYFTVSLGKDYSALYGGVLEEQTRYVARCIKQILSLYRKKVKKIVLIGHSMGGIIAKGALLLVPEVNSDVASILITLATSHNPAIYPDYNFYSYHQKLSKSLAKIKENGTTVISIGGGPKDVLVPAYQTVDKYADLNTLTTSIPRVWLSTDHQCIIWCKQLVLSIVRALFDCVDTSQNPPAISDNPDFKLKVFKWHFVQQYSGEKRLLRRPYSEKVEFPKEEKIWIEGGSKRYSWSSKSYAKKHQLNKPTTIYLMIRVGAGFNVLSIESVNLRLRDWVFVCTSNAQYGETKTCDWGWNFSNGTRTVPGLLKEPMKKVVDLDMVKIRGLAFSHIVVRIPGVFLKHNKTRAASHNKTIENKRKSNHESDENDNREDDDEDNDDVDDDDDDNIKIYIDMHARAARQSKVVKKRSWSTEPGELTYYATLIGITDGVSVQLNELKCTDADTIKDHAVVELIEPLIPGSGQVHIFAKKDNTPKSLRLQTFNSLHFQPIIKPAELRISLDPNCAYDIVVERSGLIDRMIGTVRDRWTLLYPISVGLMLLVISQKIDSKSIEGTNVVLISVVTGILCLYLNIIVELCVSVILLHLAAIWICCSVVLFGSVAQNLAVRFLARAITFSTSWSDWLLSGLVNRVPIITTILLLSIIPATCAALAMILCIFVHFLKLSRIYEDYLEELFFASLKYFNFLKKRFKNKEEDRADSSRENMFNQLLLFLFWCLAAIPSIPSALVWAKNFSYNTKLKTEDSIYFYSWIIMIIVGTSGVVKIPTKTSQSHRNKLLATLLRCLGWVVFNISAANNGAHYHWCFPPLLASVAVLISLHSIIK